MPVYKVHVSQFVEETAVLTIDATDLDAAIARAKFTLVDGDDIDWQDGSDTMKQGVDLVTNAANKVLWPGKTPTTKA